MAAAVQTTPEYQMLVNLAGKAKADALIAKRSRQRNTDRRSELVSIHYLMTAPPHGAGQQPRF